jgi:hypothetical protein
MSPGSVHLTADGGIWNLTPDDEDRYEVVDPRLQRLARAATGTINAAEALEMDVTQLNLGIRTRRRAQAGGPICRKARSSWTARSTDAEQTGRR